MRVRTIVVNPLPATITGADNVCVDGQTTLGNTAAGGTWSTNSSPMATVGAATGVVTGTSAGSVLISYTLPTGCRRVKTLMVNPTPAAISGTMEICNGTGTTLTTTTTGGVWMSGNTSVAIVGLVGGNVTGTGAGMAMITYSMPTGCMSTAIMTVNALPATITGSTNVCEGSSIVLTNSTLGGDWSSSGAAGSINSAGVVSGTTPGNVAVTYTMPTGCYTMSNIAVNALPVAQSVTGGGNYCAGSGGANVGLDGSALLTTYKLYNGTTLVGTYSGSGAPIHFGTFTGAGMYTVSAMTAMGCMLNMGGSATISITPVVTPGVSVSSSIGDTACAGSMVTFSAATTNGGSSPMYQWMVNGAPMSTAAAYSYAPANGDVVSVQLTSSAACATPAMATAMKMMTVMSVETPSVGIGVSPAASICKGTTAVFTATAVNGGDSPAYSWMRNGVIPMGTGATLSYIPNNNDVITCWLNSSYRCAATNNVVSNGITMRVDEVYVPEVQVVATPGTTVNAGQQVTFSTTVTNAGPTPMFQWLRNGALISGATLPTYTTSNLSNGDSITCLVKGTGSCGEVTINSVVMTVLPSTGVAQTTINGSDIRLMPNPNNGAFRVSGTLVSTNNETVTMEITDVLGQVVYRNTVTATNGQLDAAVQTGNTLANGMYILNIGIGGERKAFHFVIRQ